MSVRLWGVGRVVTAVVSAVVSAGVIAARAGAQTPAATAGVDTGAVDTAPAARGRAALVGRVHTARGEAVADVELTVLGDGTGGHSGDGRAARTGPGGAFRVDSIRPGKYFVRARRLGYEPLFFAATLTGGKARRIDIELAPLPARLAAVDVRARSGYSGFGARRLDDFERRRRIGFGRFYTRDDLRAYVGRQLSDVLAYLSVGVSGRDLDAFSPFPGGTYSASYAGCGGSAAYAGGGHGYRAGDWGGPGGGFGCGVSVSLNGMLPMAGGALSDYPVSQIEALEVYGRTLVVWTGAESDD